MLFGLGLRGLRIRLSRNVRMVERLGYRGRRWVEMKREIWKDISVKNKYVDFHCVCGEI